MSDAALRPRTVVEVLDAAFSLFKRDYAKLVTIMGIVSLPVTLVMLFVGPAMFSADLASLDTGAGTDYAVAPVDTSGVLLPLLMWFAFYPLIDGALTIAASEGYLGRNYTVASVMKQFGARFFPLLGGGLLRSAFVGFGMLLLLIPGVYLYLRLFCVPALLAVEKRSVGESITRSGVLTKGFKGKILLTMCVIFFLQWILGMIAGIAAIVSSNEMVLQVATIAVTILVYPVVPITMTVLFYDLRIRKEGLDIEMLSRELGDSPNTLPAT